ncbi:hypothetical protein [Allopusillimonas ginsengisoli]|uniref:hypothetical protein n=1 Tax=Allopusillimonas ginsengisoli TaxID=453575 RepID=UPI0010220227|nr:hypothetical protein [Allopusillimonas ginsengisoli]TEA71925.1 hypothetical protein ERE07_19765 [Allopusillimonas ginsengisoli]
MDTEKFAVALNHRMRDQVLAIDESHDAYVLYLRNSRKVSIDLNELRDDPEAVMQEVEERIAMRPVIQ